MNSFLNWPAILGSMILTFLIFVFKQYIIANMKILAQDRGYDQHLVKAVKLFENKFGKHSYLVLVFLLAFFAIGGAIFLFKAKDAHNSDHHEPTSDQLRADVKIYTDQLRNFESAFEVQDQNQRGEEWNRRRELGNDVEALNRLARQDGLADDNRRNLHYAEFETRFRPQAIMYKNEICEMQKLNNPCNEREEGYLLINDPFLTGYGPIIVIANYLDKIASKLPK